MSMMHVRKRLMPFAIGALTAGLASVVNAQSTDQANQNEIFRDHTHVADVSNRAGLPGGVVMLHMPGDADDRSDHTNTPIKHVILLIGENRTFDHVFATYTPSAGQSVRNLLSEGIVNADGTQGPNVAAAWQWQASNSGPFSVAPQRISPYVFIPSMNTGSAPTQAPFSSAEQAAAIEPGLPAESYVELATGGTGLPNNAIDARFPKSLFTIHPRRAKIVG